MKLEHYISDLLHNHNCVIVPEFGGFIANYKSAVIDDSRKMIHPPSKSVLFNKNLINNDGLLGNTISNKEVISYEEALSTISSLVSTWNTTLEEGGRIEIGEIGFLCKQNDSIIFEQNREVNLLLNAYGLSSINFVTFEKEKVQEPVLEKVERKEKEQKPIVRFEDKPKIKDVEPVQTTPVIAIDSKPEFKEIRENKKEKGEKIIQLKSNSNRWKYVAVAVAIPFLFYSYWIPMETDFLDTGQIQVSDFNPIHIQKEKTYHIREDKFNPELNEEVLSWEQLTESLSENVQVYNYQFDDELYIPVRLSTEVVVENEIIEIQAVESGPYNVISGCFSVENNANNLISDLIGNGYSARIIDIDNGLHSVSSGSYSNREEANKALEELRNQGYSGWIHKD